MVIPHRIPSAPPRGWLMIELLVAMAILTVAILPIAYSFGSEKRFARAAYQHAIAMELVDGETEVLAAGAWRGFSNGVHEYTIRAAAVTNLPAGRFLLTVGTNSVRLEWIPETKRHGASVQREVQFQ